MSKNTFYLACTYSFCTNLRIIMKKLYLAISCVAGFIWLKYSNPPWHFEPLRKLCLLYDGNLMYTYFHLFQNNPRADEMQIVDYSTSKVRGRYHFKGHCRCLDGETHIYLNICAYFTWICAYLCIFAGHCRCLDRETHTCVKLFLVTFYNGRSTWKYIKHVFFLMIFQPILILLSDISFFHFPPFFLSIKAI